MIPLLIAPVLAAGAADANAQERPARWSVAVEVIGRLPSTMYARRITAREGGTELATTYRERAGFGPGLRLRLWFKPQAPFSGFMALGYGRAETVAHYSGGIEPEETIGRSMRSISLQAGMGIRLKRWKSGRGILSYVFGPILMRQSLDLSNGHRDPLAYAFDLQSRDSDLAWSDRRWFSWGLGIGMIARIPLSTGLAFHLSFQDNIMSVGTGALAAQEERDVRQLVGIEPIFRYPSYIAHYPGISIGLEYVLSREPETLALDPPRLPPPPPPGNASDVTRAALRLANTGDRAGAIARLRDRVDRAPQDDSAWRALAILLASPPPADPEARRAATAMLRRALARNPADSELLAIYGRLQAPRARTAAGNAAPLLTVSEVNAVADPAGRLSLAWAVHRSGDRPRPYRVHVDVFDGDGAPVRIRLVRIGGSAAAPLDPAGVPLDSAAVPLDSAAIQDDPAALTADSTRIGADSTDFVIRYGRRFDDPAVKVHEHRLEVGIAQPRTGRYTARIRITDVVTGSTITRVVGFTLP